MPRRRKSAKLKKLEAKLAIVKREIQRRKRKLSSSSSPRRNKRTRTPTNYCLSILDRLSKLQYCKDFLDPVDAKELGVPQYTKVIKHPMDFSSIRARLKSGGYKTPYLFAKDVRLVYQNACKFNKFNTVYYNNAIKLCRKFEDEFERHIIDKCEQSPFTKSIGKVLATVLRHGEAVAFYQPVDPVHLEILDYLELIKEPMDLGTMYNRIVKYTRFKDFMYDLNLIWYNCKTYNPRSNLVHQQALHMDEFVSKTVKRYCTQDYALYLQNEDASPEPYSPSMLRMDTPPISSISSSILVTPKEAVPSKQMNHSASSDHSMTIVNHNHNTVPEMVSIQPTADIENSHSHSRMEVDDDADEDDDDEEEDDDDDEDDENEKVFPFQNDDEDLDSSEESSLIRQFLLTLPVPNPDELQQLSQQQKQYLQKGILTLNPDHFEPLIQMLTELLPENMENECELDIDCIDESLQVRMYCYMLRAIHTQENENASTEQPKLYATMFGGLNNQNYNQNQNQNQNQNELGQPPQNAGDAQNEQETILEPPDEVLNVINSFDNPNTDGCKLELEDPAEQKQNLNSFAVVAGLSPISAPVDEIDMPQFEVPTVTEMSDDIGMLLNSDDVPAVALGVVDPQTQDDDQSEKEHVADDAVTPQEFDHLNNDITNDNFEQTLLQPVSFKSSLEAESQKVGGVEQPKEKTPQFNSMLDSELVVQNPIDDVDAQLNKLKSESASVATQEQGQAEQQETTTEADGNPVDNAPISQIIFENENENEHVKAGNELENENEMIGLFGEDSDDNENDIFGDFRDVIDDDIEDNGTNDETNKKSIPSTNKPETVSQTIVEENKLPGPSNIKKD